MKKHFALTFFIVSLSSTAANAFDLGGVKVDVGDKCLDKAVALASSAGVATLAAYDKYSQNQDLTAVNLGIAAPAFKNLQEYVSTGCAKSHLEKALKTLN